MSATTVAPVVAAAAPAAPKATRTRTAKVTVHPIRKAVPEQPVLLASKAAARFDDEKDFSYLADKEPTDLHVSMAAWLTEVTGVEVSAKQVQIVAVLRHDFQASPTNQRDLKARRDAAEAKRIAEAKRKVEAAKKAKAAADKILRDAAKAEKAGK